MTDDAAQRAPARVLKPGDRPVQGAPGLIARVGRRVNPPARTVFTVRRVANCVGFGGGPLGGMRIGSEGGFWFVPQEVERVAEEEG